MEQYIPPFFGTGIIPDPIQNEPGTFPSSSKLESKDGLPPIDPFLGTLLHKIIANLSREGPIRDPRRNDSVQQLSFLANDGFQKPDPVADSDIFNRLNILRPDVFDQGPLGNLLYLRMGDVGRKAFEELENQVPENTVWSSEVAYQASPTMVKAARQIVNPELPFHETLSSFGPPRSPQDANRVITELVRGRQETYVIYGNGPVRDLIFEQIVASLNNQGIKVGRRSGDIWQFNREDILTLARVARDKHCTQAKQSAFVMDVILPLAALINYAYLDLFSEDPELPQGIPLDFIETIALPTARHDMHGYWAQTEEGWQAIDDFIGFANGNGRKNLHDMIARVDDSILRKLARFVALKWTGDIRQIYVEVKTCFQTVILMNDRFRRVDPKEGKIPVRHITFIAHALLAQFIWELKLLQECINRGIISDIPPEIQAQVRQVIADPTSWSGVIPYFGNGHEIILMRVHFPIVNPSLREQVDPERVLKAPWTVVLDKLALNEALQQAMKTAGRRMVWRFFRSRRQQANNPRVMPGFNQDTGDIFADFNQVPDYSVDGFEAEKL